MKSRFIITILFLCVISLKGIASCYPVDIKNEYFSSDVVLAGKISRVFDLERDQYKISIEINEVFRGDSISTFIIYSTPEDFYELINGDTNKYFTSLDIFLRENENWIIFANKDNRGVYSTNACKMTGKYDSFRPEEIDFLRSKPKIDDITFSFDESNLPYIAIGKGGYFLDYKVFIDDSLISSPINCNIIIDTTGQIISFKSFKGSNENIDQVVYRFLKSKEPYSVGTYNGIKVKTEYFLKVDKR